MEESALILAELQRIRVLLSRFMVFVAVFALLVVLPAMAMLSFSAYVWTFGLAKAVRETPGFSQAGAEFPQPDARALKFAEEVPEMAQRLNDEVMNLARKAFRPGN